MLARARPIGLILVGSHPSRLFPFRPLIPDAEENLPRRRFRLALLCFYLWFLPNSGGLGTGWLTELCGEAAFITRYARKSMRPLAWLRLYGA